MLDIGCGSGTYAKMFPDADWTGVEIWEPYVEKYGLTNLYGNLYVEDARTWEPVAHYDVAFAGDILEHMTVDEAKSLLARLKSCADTVVVSIPIGHYPQGEYEGNPHEAHITDNWTDEEVRRVFGEPSWAHVDGEIGVYIWSKHPIKLKICVYAISKNEAHFIQRFCESAKEADMILIADTGSTDGLPEEAERHGAIVHHISISPWRFDTARNMALSMLPKDIDLCIALDMDEQLQPGWREALESLPKKVTRPRYKYVWSWNPDGSEGLTYGGDKIHARHGYRWKHPVHETITAVIPEQQEWVPLEIHHHPDNTKSRSQYFPLLETAKKESPQDDRTAFYYARELFFHGRLEEAASEFQRHLNLPLAVWKPERAASMRYIAKCGVEPEKWFTLATLEAPNRREPWIDLGNYAYKQHDWRQVVRCCERALQITEKPLEYFAIDATPYAFKIYVLTFFLKTVKFFGYGEDSAVF
jgi:glycosyltransferase involved in cell wall biosynthesis